MTRLSRPRASRTVALLTWSEAARATATVAQLNRDIGHLLPCRHFAAGP